MEPYLTRIFTRDSEVPEEVFTRIEHYLRIFERCSRAMYSVPLLRKPQSD